MKKIILFICLCVGYFSFSSFGFIDSPKAIHVKSTKGVKIKSQSEVQKIAVDKIVITDFEEIESEKLDEKKISILTKIISAFRFTLTQIYNLFYG